MSRDVQGYWMLDPRFSCCFLGAACISHGTSAFFTALSGSSSAGSRDLCGNRIRQLCLKNTQSHDWIKQPPFHGCKIWVCVFILYIHHGFWGAFNIWRMGFTTFKPLCQVGKTHPLHLLPIQQGHSLQGVRLSWSQSVNNLRGRLVSNHHKHPKTMFDCLIFNLIRTGYVMFDYPKAARTELASSQKVSKQSASSLWFRVNCQQYSRPETTWRFPKMGPQNHPE